MFGHKKGGKLQRKKENRKRGGVTVYNCGKIKQEVVPGAGLEPARGCPREILSLLRLPISPSGLYITKITSQCCFVLLKHHCYTKMEAGVGIEPAYTELQSAA